MKDMNIGINEKERKEIATGLSRLLADSYTLYLQTQNFHWNVTGPMFEPLHLMFGEQYTELAEAVDLIAERIRTLGFAAPATFSDFKELSTIKETRESMTSAKMIETLLDSQETILRLLRVVSADAAKLHDEGTYDILIQRTKVHEKNAWMLRSSLPL